MTAKTYKGHITCDGCSFNDGEKCTNPYSSCPSEQWRESGECYVHAVEKYLLEGTGEDAD